MGRFLTSLAILIMSIFVLYLGYTGKIALFIHPRYFEMTKVAGLISMAFSGAGALYFAESVFNKGENRIRFDVLTGVAILAIFSIFGFIYPLKPISSATLSQRSSEINFVQNPKADLNKFSTNTKEYKISEWVYLFQTDPDWNKFVGKEVDVEGFIYKDERLPDAHFLVARFIISCCAVDARPVGIPVSYEWEDEYEEDQWVNVVGKFELRDVGDGEELVIVPDSVEAIDIPDNPYIY